MSKIKAEELAEVAVAVRNAATPEELTKQTARLLKLLDEGYASSAEADVRLHALNLAVAFHKSDAVVHVDGGVLETAQRFAEFIGAAE